MLRVKLLRVKGIKVYCPPQNLFLFLCGEECTGISKFVLEYG
jgi:hypothetical protein